MNDNKREVVYGRVPLTTILFVVFLVLKLCGVIDWPWIWVFAPLWIPFALVLVLFIVLAIIYFIVTILDKRITRRWRP